MKLKNVQPHQLRAGLYIRAYQSGYGEAKIEIVKICGRPCKGDVFDKASSRPRSWVATCVRHSPVSLGGRFSDIRGASHVSDLTGVYESFADDYGTRLFHFTSSTLMYLQQAIGKQRFCNRTFYEAVIGRSLDDQEWDDVLAHVASVSEWQ